MSKKLENEVWDIDRCAGCGDCVTACSKRILSFVEDGEHPQKKVINRRVGLTDSVVETCHFCEMEGVMLCEESCPRLKEDWTDGPVLKELLVTTAGKNKSGNPNDIIANMLAGAIQTGLIDGVVISDMDRWTLIPQPKVATSIAEVVESVGHQYIWCPTLQGLKEAIYTRKLRKVAFVGLPCMIQGIDRIASSDAKAMKYLASRIKVRVGLFCSGVYKAEALKEISEKTGIAATAIKEIVVSQKDDQLTVTTFDGKKKSMKMSTLSKFIRKGCGRCYDLLSEASDISIGPIGAKKGSATVLVRTPAGENVFENAMLLKLLVAAPGQPDTKAIKEAKDAKQKRKQADMIDGLKILMLEALKDPARSEEAKKKFGELYYRKTTTDQPPKQDVKSGCDSCTLCG